MVISINPIVEITSSCAYCQHVGHEFKNCPFVHHKLKRLMREKFITSPQPIVLSTLATHVGVHVQQLRPQLGLVLTQYWSINI